MSDPTSPIIDQISNADTERKEELEPEDKLPRDEQEVVAPVNCYNCNKVLYEGDKSQKKGFYYPKGPMCGPCQGHYEVCAYQKQKTHRFLHPELFPLGKWEELISTQLVCITCTEHVFDSESRKKDGKMHLEDSERLCSTCNGFNCSICVQHGKEIANGLFVCMFCAFETPPECDIGFCDDCGKTLKQAEVEVKKSKIEHAGRGLFCDDVKGFEAEHDVCDFDGTIVTTHEFNTVFGHPWQRHQDVMFNSLELQDQTRTLICDQPDAPGRYANCSKKPDQDKYHVEKNNCSLVVKGDKAYLKTRCRIDYGQELFVPYGAGYWNYHNSKTDPKPSKQPKRTEVELALRDKTLQQVKELQKIIKNHPTFLVDKNAKDYDEKWRASQVFTSTALENAKVLPASDSAGFFHSTLPDEHVALFNAVADVVTETAFEKKSFMDWGECGWMSGRMMKAIFNNTEGENQAWKAHPLTDDWLELTAVQQQQLNEKIISGEFQVYNDLVRNQMPFQASVDLDDVNYLGALNIGGSAMPHTDIPELPPPYKQRVPGTGPGNCIVLVNLKKGSLIGFCNVDKKKGTKGGDEWQFLWQEPGTITIFWGNYRVKMVHGVINLEVDNEGSYPLVTEENAKTLRQSLTFRCGTLSDKWVKLFAKFDWLVETEVQETSDVPRAKRQKKKREPSIKTETLSGSPVMRKKQRAGTASQPIAIDVEDDGAQDEVVVRGWGTDIAANPLKLLNEDDGATMMICNSIEKTSSGERLKFFDYFKTYEVKDGATVSWSLLILAVGVCRHNKSSRACALMSAQSDMPGSKWGAPFWIGASRLVGLDAKIVAWPGGSRPSCKQYDTETKVKKFLESSSSNIRTHFREQGFIQNMLPHCQATPPKPTSAKPDSKPTTTAKHGSKKKAGMPPESEDTEGDSSNLLTLLQKAAEGSANSLGHLQPYNSQTLAASSYAPGQGAGSDIDIQNQFNMFMIQQQRETQGQLFHMQQQQQSMPNANVSGEQITFKDFLNMQQATATANAQVNLWQQSQLALAQERSFALLDKFATASSSVIQVHSHTKQTQRLLQTSRCTSLLTAT